VNRFAAKPLIWSGAAIVVAAVVFCLIPGLTLDEYSLACLAVFVIAMGIGLIQSFQYLKQLTHSSDQQSANAAARPMKNLENRMIESRSTASKQTIRRCEPTDFEAMCQIINDAAEAYRHVIPPDRWHEPYMPREELANEIRQGVAFWGLEQDGVLLGVMGLQPVKDVTLIRHAYVTTAHRGRGIGGSLLKHLLAQTPGAILVGTWAAASWAVRFYEKHGFRQVTPLEKDRLLRTYWSIPDRQVETSVVLAFDR
jgi:N-acetylglutamate synthase-like GNAT family acetyltransferase